MKRITNRSLLPYLLFIICYLLFSCKSATKTTELTLLESGILPLDKGASAYVLIDVVKAKPVLEKLSYIPMTDKNMKMMIDKTRSAVLAVFTPSSTETRLFQLVSWGSYPASGSSLAFGANKDWKKQKSAFLDSVYWHSDKAQLSVAVTSSQAYVLVAMSKDPHDPIPLSGGIKIPDGFREFAGASVLSCWLSEPGSVLNKKLKAAGIPLEIPAEQFFVSLFPADRKASASQPEYEANIKITVPTTAQARAVATFISIARTFMPPPAKPDEEVSPKNAEALANILFANPVIQEGNSLIIKTPPLGLNEISLLFSMF